jgi:hypothetical protein
VDALQTWTLTASVNSGTQGVVWFNGHCLGRQITNQSPLFVPEAWLKPTNTILLVTQGGGAPSGYSLSPVEYHSLVKSPVATSSIKSGQISSLAGVVAGSATIVSTGNRLSLPASFGGKSGSVSIYDLQGHLVAANVAVRDGEAVVPNGKTIPRGVFIARTEK